MSDDSPARLGTITGAGSHDVRMLLLIFAGWSIIQIGQTIIPPLLPLIISDLSISPFIAGIALTAMNALYAIGMFPSGQVSDKLTRITPIVCSLGLIAIGSLLVAGATTFHVFLLGICVFGIAKAFYVTPTRALISDLFESRRGRALGIVTVGSDLGGVLAGGIAIVAIAYGSWRAPFVPLAMVLVGLLGLFHAWSRERYVFRWTGVDVRKPLTRILGDGQLRRLIAAYALFWFAGLSVLNFLPVFLEATKPVSLEQATSLFTLLFITGMITKPFAGSLSDRIPRAWVSTGALLLSVFALGGVLVANSLLTIAMCVVLFAVGWKIQPPVVEALLMDLSPEAHVGGDLGVAKSISFGVGSLGPAYTGLMAERYGYVAGFGGLVLCLLVSVALLFSLSREATLD